MQVNCLMHFGKTTKQCFDLYFASGTVLNHARVVIILLCRKNLFHAPIYRDFCQQIICMRHKIRTFHMKSISHTIYCKRTSKETG